MSRPHPYLELIGKLRRGRVQFLLVGVFGVNHYAPSPALQYATLDCDLLVEPKPKNLLKALRLLEGCGYTLAAGGEPLGKLDLWLAGRITANRASVAALKDKAVQVDVLTAIAGYSFGRLYAARRLFKAGGTTVPVASLRHLLESKRRCGRKKDLEFLRIYRAAKAGNAEEGA
jgi:hypothetical protein